MTASKTEITHAQQISFLRRILFFSDFDENELKQFLAVSKWLKVPADTLIIKEGTTEMVFYILVKGKVSIFKTLTAGEVMELTTLETGACFGEMALVSECKRSAGVKTTIESYLLRVDPRIVSTSSVFLQLKFYKRFCEILVARLELANKRVAGQVDGLDPFPAALEESLSLAVSPPPPKAAVAPKAPKAPEAPVARKVERPLSLPPMPEIKGRLSSASLKPRLQTNKSLAINPAVAARLDLLEMKNVNPRQLTDLILLDPVLSAKVLQVANSPFYRRNCQVLSIAHAMVIVGAQPLQKTMLETVEISKARKPFSGYSPLIRRFWQHGMVVGRIAELLKDLIRLEVNADMYLAGLFHDLGMLALDQREPRFYPQLLHPKSDFGSQLEKNEADYIGTSHSTAGKWLGQHLGLPPVYLEVIRHHHQPEKAGDEVALAVALVHLADLFAAERGLWLGERKTAGNIAASQAWVLIRERHRPFLDVVLSDFLISCNEELEKNWKEITGAITGSNVGN
jgi:HD-like signal output (HDOD) protein/CRP-like cAMP-binding protein